MKPFVIRARLKSPFIRMGHMTLDAILMHTLGRGDVSDLIRCDRDLYYASSAVVPAGSPVIKAPFSGGMRPLMHPEWLDVIQPIRGKNEVAISEGRQSGAGPIINSYPALVASTVEWYASGHGEQVLEILKDIPFIGKRRHSGYGEVEAWELEGGDFDGITGPLDDPLRPVPVDRWERPTQWTRVEAAWKAPYWEVRNRACCFVPLEMLP